MSRRMDTMDDLTNLGTAVVVGDDYDAHDAPAEEAFGGLGAAFNGFGKSMDSSFVEGVIDTFGVEDVELGLALPAGHMANLPPSWGVPPAGTYRPGRAPEGWDPSLFRQGSDMSFGGMTAQDFFRAGHRAQHESYSKSAVANPHKPGSWQHKAFARGAQARRSDRYSTGHGDEGYKERWAELDTRRRQRWADSNAKRRGWAKVNQPWGWVRRADGELVQRSYDRSRKATYRLRRLPSGQWQHVRRVRGGGEELLDVYDSPLDVPNFGSKPFAVFDQRMDYFGIDPLMVAVIVVAGGLLWAVSARAGATPMGPAPDGVPDGTTYRPSQRERARLRQQRARDRARRREERAAKGRPRRKPKSKPRRKPKRNAPPKGPSPQQVMQMIQQQAQQGMSMAQNIRSSSTGGTYAGEMGTEPCVRGEASGHERGAQLLARLNEVRPYRSRSKRPARPGVNVILVATSLADARTQGVNAFKGVSIERQPGWVLRTRMLPYCHNGTPLWVASYAPRPRPRPPRRHARKRTR